VGALYLIANCWFNESNYEKAISTFQEMVSKYPDSNLVPPALFKMGEAYQHMGQGEKSLRIFRKIVDNYSKFP